MIRANRALAAPARIVAWRRLRIVFNVVVGVHVYQAVGSQEKDDAGYSNIAVFARAMQLIRQDYVDEKKVTYEELTHAAMRGMLGNLDPHSQFMASEDFKEMQEDTSSRFGGLGIVVTMRDDRIIEIKSPLILQPGPAALTDGLDGIVAALWSR